MQSKKRVKQLERRKVGKPLFVAGYEHDDGTLRTAAEWAGSGQLIDVDALPQAALVFRVCYVDGRAP